VLERPADGAAGPLGQPSISGARAPVEQEEDAMIEDILKGQWNQLKGRIREQWGRLSDDDVARARGDREVLIGKIQELYGRRRVGAEAEIAGWLSSRKDHKEQTTTVG